MDEKDKYSSLTEMMEASLWMSEPQAVRRAEQLAEMERVVRFEEALSRVEEMAATALRLLRIAHDYPASSRLALIEQLGEELVIMEGTAPGGVAHDTDGE